MPVETAPDRADDERLAVRLLKMRCDLFQRDVRRGRDERHDLVGMRLDALRSPIAALLARLQ